MSAVPTEPAARAPVALLPRRWPAFLVKVAVAVVVVVVFTLPLYAIVTTALSEAPLDPGRLALWPDDFGFGNLTQAWDLGAGRAMLNSLIVVAVALPLQVGISAFAAYALARKRFRGSAVVLLVLLSTLMLPEEVIAIPLYLTLGDIPLGSGSLLDNHLGMILPLAGWAFSVFVLTEFMRAIPLELEEAAVVDGAGDVRIFFAIILPLCRPALGTCAIFGFIMIWDQYLLPLLVAQSPDLYTLPLALSSFRNNIEYGSGLTMAAALFAMVPSVLVYLALQRFLERGLTSGAVKG